MVVEREMGMFIYCYLRKNNLSCVSRWWVVGGWVQWMGCGWPSLFVLGLRLAIGIFLWYYF